MGMTFPTFVSLYYKEEHRHAITYVHAFILHFSTMTYPALRVTLVPEPKAGLHPPWTLHQFILNAKWLFMLILAYLYSVFTLMSKWNKHINQEMNKQISKGNLILPVDQLWKEAQRPGENQHRRRGSMQTHTDRPWAWEINPQPSCYWF